MRITPRRVALGTVVAAIVVFCGVQDRLTAEGVSQYVTAQREALARGGPPVPIEAVMPPAVRRSVRIASLAAGGVIACGLGSAVALAVRSRRG